MDETHVWMKLDFYLGYPIHIEPDGTVIDGCVMTFGVIKLYGELALMTLATYRKLEQEHNQNAGR